MRVSIYQQIFILLSCLFNVAIATAADMAHIVFLQGNVVIERDAQPLLLKAGDAIMEGDVITTKNESHIHLKTIDNGFMSLRPDSQLKIEAYHYQEADPKQTQIKLDLRYGVMRSVSGEGAQAAKEHYRLNTPVSAIGIRGTDYTVLATNLDSRVTVRTGGIIMAAYSEQCAVSALTSCEGPSLFANQGDAMLTLIKNQSEPKLIQNPPINQTPDGIQQPLPQEDHKSTDSKISVKMPLSATMAVLNNELSPLSKEVPTENVGRKIFWGKWQPIADMPADDVAQRLSALKLVGFNNIFMIKKDDGMFVLPEKGSASFSLMNAEAYIQKGNDYAHAVPATVQNASLNVNFAQKTFDTQLSVVGSEQTIPFYAKGNVLDNGQFYTNKYNSNGGMIGSLSGYNATEAGYVFQTNDKLIHQGYTAIGITNWQK